MVFSRGNFLPHVMVTRSTRANGGGEAMTIKPTHAIIPALRISKTG